MNNQFEAMVFFLSFLFLMVIVLKILFESQLHTVFKQGHIFTIRLAYVLIAFIISYLGASAVLSIIQAIKLIVS